VDWASARAARRQPRTRPRGAGAPTATVGDVAACSTRVSSVPQRDEFPTARPKCDVQIRHCHRHPDGTAEVSIPMNGRAVEVRWQFDARLRRTRPWRVLLRRRRHRHRPSRSGSRSRSLADSSSTLVRGRHLTREMIGTAERNDEAVEFLRNVAAAGGRVSTQRRRQRRPFHSKTTTTSGTATTATTTLTQRPTSSGNHRRRDAVDRRLRTNVNDRWSVALAAVAAVRRVMSLCSLLTDLVGED